MQFKAIVASAEGYNSGAVGVGVFFLPPDLDDRLVDYIHENLEYSFSELDGKHSEVEADICTEYGHSALLRYEEETESCLENYVADVLSGWDFAEGAVTCTDSIIKYNRMMREKLSSKTVVEFYYNDELLAFN